ncbi:MAG: hypothetical protein K6T86_06405, partial [Pirellulales bacterium]|nr:hypothetical protein [Pirellulales bacterium]
MPQGENFFNPYRWVPVANQPPELAAPHYHHRFEGLTGELDCTLTALTPILIGGSKEPGQFIRSKRTNKPFIPATSLKGLIRSLVEVVGNAAIPFQGGMADSQHELSCAASRQGPDWRLDVAARMFGYLNRGDVFAGLVRFSDGVCETEKRCTPVAVVVGQPRPENHKPFYWGKPDKAQRKFYHHHPGATSLTPAPPNIHQTRKVSPLGPESRFGFSVRFHNLCEEELSLLLYALVLEEDASVTLSKAALRPDAKGPVELKGPMRHKLGACKPAGGGSVHIQVVRMKLWRDLAARYRGERSEGEQWQGAALVEELRRRTQQIRSRTDPTMQALRAMLI